MHVNVTRSPTDLWVAQQLREATPYGQAPTYLIRDNDRKFGSHARTRGSYQWYQSAAHPVPNAMSECRL